MRLVLDTNVWLDWLVFGGKEVAGLRAAHHAGTATFVIDRACLDELARVLAYPIFNLDAVAISLRLDAAGAVAETFPGNPGELRALPRCRDPDDQKFLQLAAAARVSCLVTRDQALLRLGKRTARLCGFDIRKPGQWNLATSQSRRLTDSDTSARAVR